MKKKSKRSSTKNSEIIIKPEISTEPEIANKLNNFAINYIITIVLVLVSLFLLLPLLFKIVANKLLACAITILFIPLLRVVGDMLLSDKKVSLQPRSILRNYLLWLFSLIFQLLLLLLILPAIALPLLSIVGGILILVMIIFIIIWFLQSQFGLQIGRPIPFDEIKLTAYVFIITLISETVILIVISIGKRYMDQFFDLYASVIHFAENKIKEII